MDMLVKAEEHNEKMGSITIQVRIISIVISIIVVAVFYFVARAILGPIRSTTLMLKDIVEGDGDLTQRIEIQADDEAGELARLFNFFISKLQAMIGDVCLRTEELAGISPSVSSEVDSMSLHTETTSVKAAGVSVSSNQVKRLPRSG